MSRKKDTEQGKYKLATDYLVWLFTISAIIGIFLFIHNVITRLGA